MKGTSESAVVEEDLMLIPTFRSNFTHNLFTGIKKFLKVKGYLKKIMAGWFNAPSVTSTYSKLSNISYYAYYFGYRGTFIHQSLVMQVVQAVGQQLLHAVW